MVTSMPHIGSGLAGSEGQAMSLPLSKYYDPNKDLPELAEELAVVDEHFTKDSPQSEHRRWEYALALRAENTWRKTTGKDIYIGYDVGGAGSPFYRMASVGLVVDPNAPAPGDYTLENFVTPGTELASMVTCLSVLEHVEDLDQFLYHLSCLVAPGGLLFLTMDCCGCEGKLYHTPENDPHHFNGMRNRIFTPGLLHTVAWTLEDLHFTPLDQLRDGFERYAPRLYGGATDPGYSFASLALVKRA